MAAGRAVSAVAAGGWLARAAQAVIDDHVTIACVDQGYTGERAAHAAAKHGMALGAVKLPQAKRGFVLSPRRWVIEQSCPDRCNADSGVP